MFPRLLAPIFFALAMTGTALAQDAPPQQVQVWSIPETVRLGQAIWRQDMASARATDAFLAAYAGKLPEGLIGWIVVEDGRNQRVRFLAGTMDAPRAFKDVVVDDRLRAGAVVDAADLTLTPDELARFSARMTAALGIGTLRCAARYNPVILKIRTERDGWSGCWPRRRSRVWCLWAATIGSISAQTARRWSAGNNCRVVVWIWIATRSGRAGRSQACSPT